MNEQTKITDASETGDYSMNRILKIKALRAKLDEAIQEIKTLLTSAEVTLSLRRSQEAVMWLGMELKRLSALHAATTPNVEAPTPVDQAKAAYHRYGMVTDFKNFQGNPMPTWEELPTRIQTAWVAAITDPTRHPYPDSKVQNTVINPTADGLKL